MNYCGFCEEVRKIHYGSTSYLDSRVRGGGALGTRQGAFGGGGSSSRLMMNHVKGLIPSTSSLLRTV